MPVRGINSTGNVHVSNHFNTWYFKFRYLKPDLHSQRSINIPHYMGYILYNGNNIMDYLYKMTWYQYPIHYSQSTLSRNLNHGMMDEKNQGKNHDMNSHMVWITDPVLGIYKCVLWRNCHLILLSYLGCLIMMSWHWNTVHIPGPLCHQSPGSPEQRAQLLCATKQPVDQTLDQPVKLENLKNIPLIKVVIKCPERRDMIDVENDSCFNWNGTDRVSLKIHSLEYVHFPVVIPL